MKKTNKGFSLVELIIVIAIMAILAGALAPQLIKYINKSRLSSDVQTGSAIQSAIQAALANEAAYDVAQSTYDTAYTEVAGFIGASTPNSFQAEVKSALGNSTGVGKSKKDIKGTSFTDTNFYFYIDLNNNTTEIYYGTGSTKPTSTDWRVSPVAGANMVN